MPLWSGLLPAVLAGLPTVYELDFRALPAPETIPAHRYKIVVEVDGKEGAVLNITLGTSAGPSDGVQLLVGALDAPWKLKRDGDQVMIYAHGQSRVTKVTVTGDGPKPLVRRVVVPPDKKK